MNFKMIYAVRKYTIIIATYSNKSPYKKANKAWYKNR